MSKTVAQIIEKTGKNILIIYDGEAVVPPGPIKVSELPDSLDPALFIISNCEKNNVTNPSFEIVDSNSQKTLLKGQMELVEERDEKAEVVEDDESDDDEERKPAAKAKPMSPKNNIAALALQQGASGADAYIDTLLHDVDPAIAFYIYSLRDKNKELNEYKDKYKEVDKKLQDLNLEQRINEKVAPMQQQMSGLNGNDLKDLVKNDIMPLAKQFFMAKQGIGGNGSGNGIGKFSASQCGGSQEKADVLNRILANIQQEAIMLNEDELTALDNIIEQLIEQPEVITQMQQIQQQQQ